MLSIDNSWCTISYKVNDVEVDVKNVEAVNEIEKGGYIVKEWTQSMSFPAFRGENCNHVFHAMFGSLGRRKLHQDVLSLDGIPQ